MAAALQSSGDPASTCPFALAADRWSSADLPIVRIRGTEQISRLFRFEILLARVDHAPATFERELLGQPAHLTLLGGHDEGRTIHGLIRRIEAEGVLGDPTGRHGYRLWLAPRLWLAGRGKNSRIFQDLTVPQITDRILDEWSLPRRWKLAQKHAPRTYCVQYQESDLTFLQRILADEGIFFHFEHPDDERGGEEIVFTDDAHLVGPIGGDPALEAREGDALASHGDSVRRFRLRQEVRAGAVLLKDFDFIRPAHDLRAEAHVPARPDAFDPARLHVYDHHGEIERSQLDDAVARLHLEQHRARASVGVGESRCRRLLPGQWFDLSGSPADDHDGRYTLFRVDHEGHVPERRSETNTGEVYRNTFRCVPLDVPFRPRRPRREIRQVTETATVVGPPGHEIHTDELGRIKVHFHWDREGQNTPNSSCWIRVAQAWAGTGWGFQFIPRVGMEVLVTFVGGDVDHPVVTGCVYNAQHPHPFRLPASKTKSGIVTQTTRGGGGHNELSFEDRAGYERVHVHAQKDLDIAVENDETTRIGVNRTEQIGGNRFTLVGGNSLSSVGGNLTHAVTGNETWTVEGNRSSSVQGDATSRIEGNDISVVNGQANRRIAQDLTTHIQGHERREVDGASETRFGDEVTVRAVGSTVTVVGKHGAARSYTLRVEGTTDLSSSSTTEISSEKEVVLRCGKSTLRLAPDHIELCAPAIFLQAEGSTAVLAKDEVRLHAKAKALVFSDDKVLLKSSGATVSLTADAKIDGAAVKLKSPDSESDSGSQAAVKRTKIELKDQAGQPLAYQRFLVLLEDGSERGGMLDRNGKAEMVIEGAAEIVFLDLANVEEA